MKNVTCSLVKDTKSLLGEGLCWSEQEKVFYWIDIDACLIHRICPKSYEMESADVGQMIGTVSLVEDGRLIVGLDNGIGFYHFGKRELCLFANPESHLPSNRMNDGKASPDGKFWVGSLSKEGEKTAGGLYMLDSDGSIQKKRNQVGCSNGIAWDTDKKVMYYIDTYTQKIDAYDYDSDNGVISNQRVIVKVEEEDGWPDGMTIDREGMLWVAHWGGSAVIRYNPNTGEKLLKIDVPASQVTSCAFGGEEMDDLYITTARVDLSDEQLEKEPLAGSLFHYKADVQGWPSYRYRADFEN